MEVNNWKADAKSFEVIDVGPYSKDNKDYYFWHNCLKCKRHS
jgi:hypothetical protein